MTVRLALSFLLFSVSSALVQHISFRKPSGFRLYATDGEALFEGAFPDAQILEIVLTEHKPLGCTVEESLGDTTLKPVFVSKVVEGGFADLAGIKAGDVIVGATGIFGGLTNVLGKGIEEVTSSVAGRAVEEPLEFRIARGTSVQARHDTALVDLCTSVGVDDQEIEECVVNFLESTYGTEMKYDDQPEEAVEETDEILQTVFDNLWGDEIQEMPVQTKPEEKSKTETVEPKKVTKAMPWRSRSSPSGTFVRDPKTGKMKNIDAQ